MNFINANLGLIVNISTILLFTIILIFLLDNVLSYIKNKILRIKPDNIMMDSAYKPLQIIIFIIGTSLILIELNTYFNFKLSTKIIPTRDIGILACIAWYALKLLNLVEQNIIENKRDIDRTTVSIIRKIVHIAILTIATLSAFQILGVSMKGVLAFGGIGGVAIGFASKDLLSNFFGALIIYLDKPFKVGDAIRLLDNDVSGVVKMIGWRQTKIMTYENRPIYIPNSIFNTTIVENITKMKNRRIVETVGISYEDINKLDGIIADTKKMIEDRDDISFNDGYVVNLNGFGDKTADILIYLFLNTKQWAEAHAIKQDILLKVRDIANKHKAKISLPVLKISDNK